MPGFLKNLGLGCLLVAVAVAVVIVLAVVVIVAVAIAELILFVIISCKFEFPDTSSFLVPLRWKNLQSDLLQDFVFIDSKQALGG